MLITVQVNAVKYASKSCSPGSTSPTGVVPCKPCINGTYTNGGGATQCISCIAGSYCPNITSYPILCPINTFSNDNATVCIPCPNSTYALSVGSSECMTCPPGHSCSKSSVPKKCLPGTYNIGGSTTKCSRCLPGSISYTGDSECEICPLDQYSLNNKVCSWCNVGHVVDGTRSGCIDCKTVGQYTDDGIKCKTCPLGSKLDTDSGGCILCAPGEYSNNHRTCNQCEPGTFTNVRGASTCTQCVDGSIARNVGSTECVKCPLHSHSTADGTRCKCNFQYQFTSDRKTCVPTSIIDILVDNFIDDLRKNFGSVQPEIIPDDFEDSDNGSD